MFIFSPQLSEALKSEQSCHILWESTKAIKESYEIILLIKKNNKHCIIREYCEPYILKSTKIIYGEETEFKKISASDFHSQKLTIESI